MTVILGVVAGVESATPVARDDFGYLMWGLQTAREPWAWVSGPPWFSYWRPLNALTWWLSAHTGIDGEFVRWANVSLWVGLGVTLTRFWKLGPGVSFGIMCLLVTNPVLIDLLRWRSWIATTGSIAFLVVGAHALERRASAIEVALWGVLAIGMKEMGGAALAMLAIVRPGYRVVGGLLLAVVVAGAAPSVQKLSVAYLLQNLEFHQTTLAGFVAIVPALLAARFPAVGGWLFLPLVALGLLPEVVRASVVILSAALLLSTERRWALAGLVALVLPQFGSARAQQYLVEHWVVVAMALSFSGTVGSVVRVMPIVAILGVPLAVQYAGDREILRQEFAEQREFVRSFRPDVAESLFHPDPMWAWNLDALYWVRHGAVIRGTPPIGSMPVQVGPLSGVWADATLQDSEEAQGQ